MTPEQSEHKIDEILLQAQYGDKDGIPLLPITESLEKESNRKRAKAQLLDLVREARIAEVRWFIDVFWSDDTKADEVYTLLENRIKQLERPEK